MTTAQVGGAVVDVVARGNAFTVDFEDWYQGLEIPPESWVAYEDRIEAAGHRLLDVLAAAGVRGTFFVLGYVAERHPALVREIAGRGHEIGTHGHSHGFVYVQSPGEFRAELERSLGFLRDLTGQDVIGFRAPYFSITRRSLWALDVMAECGIRYDSSIFPVMNYRYGIPDAPRWPFAIETASRPILEFPVSTWRVAGRNVPIGGGAYFRIFPYAVTRAAFRALNRAGRPAVFYLHPWELDAGQPRLPLPRRIALTHYFRLRATEPRLRRLLREVSFRPMREVLGVH